MLKHRFGAGGLGSVSAKKKYPKTMKRSSLPISGVRMC